MNQRIIFVVVEKVADQNENNALLIMSRCRTDQGCQWVKENYGEELKYVADKQCESNRPTSKGENTDSARDVEEHMKN